MQQTGQVCRCSPHLEPNCASPVQLIQAQPHQVTKQGKMHMQPFAGMQQQLHTVHDINMQTL
jgi:hypothetical protein